MPDTHTDRGKKNRIGNQQGSQSLEQAIVLLTLAKIKDQLTTELALASMYVKDEKSGLTHILFKYYEKAAYMMYRIPVYETVPTFDIGLEDLSFQLKHELAGLRKSDRKMFWYTVRIAVAHIFENINFDYFHNSVMRYLKIRFIRVKR